MRKIYLMLAGLLGIHLFLLFNLQFTAWPEILSYPYLLNNGFKLYGDMVYAYPPLLTFILAGVYKIFGYGLTTLKVFTWVLILANDVLIFLIVRDLTKKNIYALLSVIFYLLLQPFLDGNQLWFDFAITTPILLSLYFRKKLVLAGTFLVIALLMKQTAVFFAGLFFLYMIFSGAGLRKIILFLSPIIASFLILFVWLILTGQFNWYYNWNFYYPLTFWTKYPSYEILELSKKELAIVLFILAPSLLLFAKERRITLPFLFLLAGIVAVYPRISFYHFQPALAVAAVLFGVFLHSFKTPKLFLATYYLAIIAFICAPSVNLYWQKETRFFGREDLKTARIIEDKIPEGESVYLLGPHSANYVLSETLPPRPWVDNFGWYFEIPKVQEETIKLWEKDYPEGIFIQNPMEGAWYEIGTYQPKKIMEWIGLNYERKGEVIPGLWYWKRK